MLTGDNTKIREVKGLAPTDKQNILSYLQELANNWNQNNGDKWFTARTLLAAGGANWAIPPLQILYSRQIVKGKTPAYAYRRASIDVGYLLKAALAADQHTFTTARGYIRKYHW